MPKVSVIVPVYNVETYIARCLDSILHQTCTDYEIICINDCSPDKSGEILRQFQHKYPSILRVLNNETNIGLGRTRERGIRHAKGRYILFIDSDDYIEQDYIETYLHAMESTPCDVIIGGFIRDVEGKLTTHNVPDSIWSSITYVIACAKMFRKKFLIENKLEFTDVRCGEDIYFSLSLFYAGAVCHVIDYCGYYYYFNRLSITGSMNYKKNHEEFISQIFSHFLENHDISKIPLDRRQVIEYTYIANMVNALITYGHGAKPRLMKQKYEFVMRDMKNKFPDYRHNPYIGFFKPKGQTLKIRIGVGTFMLLHKLRLDKLMFYIVSLY